MQSSHLTPRLPRTSLRSNSHHHQQPGGRNGASLASDSAGVSRIPHQVSKSSPPHSHCNGADSGRPAYQPTRSHLAPDSDYDSIKLGGGGDEPDLELDDRRKRYLTFSKDQASSHVRSIKEELLGGQQSLANNNQSPDQQPAARELAHLGSSEQLRRPRNLLVSGAAKSIEQRARRFSQANNSAQEQQQQQAPQRERLFFGKRNSQLTSNGQPQAELDRSDTSGTAIEPSEISSLANQAALSSSANKPRPLERLSKLAQQQQQPQSSLARVFPSPRNSVQNAIKSNDSAEQEPSSAAFIKSNSETTSSKNGASFRQQPICEAFIMTGQSMMKLSSNESDQHQHQQPIKSGPTQDSTTNNNTIYNNHNNISHPSNQQATDSQQHYLNLQQKVKSISLNRLDTNGSERISSALSIDSADQLGDKSSNSAQLNHSESRPNEQAELEARPRAFIAGPAQIQQQQQQQQQQKARLSHGLASLMWSQQQQLLQQQHQADVAAAAAKQKVPILDAAELARYQHALANNVAQENNGPTSQAADCRRGSEGQQQSGTESNCRNLLEHCHLTNPSVNHISDIKNLQMEQETRDLKAPGDQVAISAANDHSPNASEQVDRQSARRLAKRLYNLSEFKRSDVCHHLAKLNPFGQMVAEEYLRLFDFRSMKLDAALRKFLSKLQLLGETQQRERVLGQFSHRYYECNKEKFPSSEVVQTLVCAIILLNTDLHGNHPGRKSSKKSGSLKHSKLSLSAWIDGLNSSLKAQCANGQSANIIGQLTSSTPGYISASFPISINSVSASSDYSFPRHLLVDLYESIKKRPLKCGGDDKSDMTSFQVELDKIYSQQFGNSNGSRSNTMPTRRFAPGTNAPSSTFSSRCQPKYGSNGTNGNVDDGDFTIEFKSGFLNRKRIFESQGKPTSFGRRGWKRVYVILRDLRLIIRYNYELPEQEMDNSERQTNDQCNENSPKKQASPSKRLEKKQVALDLKNTLRLHHSTAKPSTTYTKRDYVFHLRLANQTEFLLQASSEQEMKLWVDTINFASACLSSPALPSAVSNSKRYQLHQRRPILPTSYTKLSYWEQLIDHEERLQRFKQELEELINEAPQKKNADKRVKSEYIERIAYLKQEIERYNVYVELMRKKSNSPEAIILSKHPHMTTLSQLNNSNDISSNNALIENRNGVS